MNKQFEKLPEIKSQIHKFIFDSDLNCYRNKVKSTGIHLVTWVNGAWYAYQEQQKKIDGVLSHINKKCDEFCESHDMDKVALLEEIEELLK